MNGSTLCFSGMVERMKSKLSSSSLYASLSPSITTRLAPSALPGSTLSLSVVNTVTSAPIAIASFTAMWPSPPRPTMPTLSPALTPQCLSGE